MPPDEEDVAGEHHPIAGDVDQDVAACVRGADLDQLDLLAVDRQRELTFERLVGLAHGDALELEGPEDAGQELAEHAHARRLAHEGGQRLRRRRPDLVGAFLGGEDAGVAHKLVTPAVVAIGVRIDNGVDPARERCQLVEHLPGQLEVKEGVDEQRACLADHQPGVAPPPRAVGLQVGKHAVGDFVDTPLVRRPGAQSSSNSRSRGTATASSSRSCGVDNTRASAGKNSTESSPAAISAA